MCEFKEVSLQREVGGGGGQQESASDFSQMPFEMLQFDPFRSHSCGWQSAIT